MMGNPVQGSANGWPPGLVNFVAAVAYLFLTGFACSIHTTWGPPFSRALYKTSLSQVFSNDFIIKPRKLKVSKQ